MENEWLDQNKRFLALAAQFGFDTLDSGTPTTEVKQILILCLIKIIFLLLEFYSFFLIGKTRPWRTSWRHLQASGGNL